MRVALYAAAKRAKLPADFRPHDLRHRRVTTWIAEGQNPVHVKEAMGHSDLRVTMGYTHLAKEHLRALVEDRQPLATQANTLSAVAPG
jgi:site-specific recombinase XerD